MRILSAAFLKSAADPSGWPDVSTTSPLEIAVCGRSNVGKSTLLNSLLGRRALARVSRTPGRTRLINFFTLRAALSPDGPPQDLLLSDLPGFGYAKVSKAERATWRPLIQAYLERRETLTVVLLLCDSRRAADLKDDPRVLEEEADLCRWLGSLGRHVIPVLTKADKLRKHERKPAQAALHRLLLTSPVVFSALAGEGRDELTRRLERALCKQPAPSAAVADTPDGGLQ